MSEWFIDKAPPADKMTIRENPPAQSLQSISCPPPVRLAENFSAEETG
ncbi:MAG: hypothetical protein LWY06_02750 [Firmicutes bacterium]|nr:hypothetical protein [Bacillota bacterium]